MGDWEFLYEMRELGYSDDDIQDAMASGAAPWEWEEIERLERQTAREKMGRQERKTAWEELKCLRNAGKISREEFRIRKKEIFG